MLRGLTPEFAYRVLKTPIMPQVAGLFCAGFVAKEPLIIGLFCGFSYRVSNTPTMPLVESHFRVGSVAKEIITN